MQQIKVKLNGSIESAELIHHYLHTRDNGSTVWKGEATIDRTGEIVNVFNQSYRPSKLWIHDRNA